MLTGSPGTPLFNVTGTWVDPGANNSVYIWWLQLLVIALIPTRRFQVSRQPRDGLPERMPSMLPSDTSAEAAEVQRTGIRELPPLEGKKVSGTFFALPRSPARPDCCFQAQPFDDPGSPPLVAMRGSTRDRMPDGRQFSLGLRGVHVVQPAGVSSEGPRCQD